MAIVGALTLGAPALRARVAAGSARVGPLEVVVALGTAVATFADRKFSS